MKSICYIGKRELWFGDRVFGWTDNSLKNILKAARKDLDIKEMIVVLGGEMSFMFAVRIGTQEKIDRKKALELAAANLPFMPTYECFDWQQVSLGEGDEWIQVAAIEPDFLKTLTEAADVAGILISEAVPAAAVLARSSQDKEAPVLIKWQGRDNLSVLAIKGLVDLAGYEPDEKINAYARHKWHLAVNPEQIVLNDKEFNFAKELDEFKKTGEDAEALGIKVKKGGIIKVGRIAGRMGGLTIEVGPELQRSRLLRVLALAAIILFLVVSLATFINLRINTQIDAPLIEPVVPIATPTVASSAALSESDPIEYPVQILNGSGVTGEAAKTRDRLVSLGFTKIEVGNAASIMRTTIAYKEEVPAEVVSQITKSLGEYEIGEHSVLKSENRFDVIVVIGRTRKE